MVLKIEPRNVSIQSTGSHSKIAAGTATTRDLAVPKDLAVRAVSGFKLKMVQARVTTATVVAAASARTTCEDAARVPTAAVSLASRPTSQAAPASEVIEPSVAVVSLPKTDIGGAQPIPAAPKNRRTRREAVRQRIDLDQQGFLRLEDVLTLIPVSRATWYAGVKDGDYPASVQIGKRAVAWRTQDIKALIDRLSGAGAPAAAINTLKGVPTP
ncbi:MAG: AlpA family phage regulatory protein [Pseudomonadota bacterium]